MSSAPTSLIVSTSTYQFPYRSNESEFGKLVINYLESIEPQLKGSEASDMVQNCYDTVGIKERFFAIPPEKYLDYEAYTNGKIDVGLTATTNTLTEPCLTSSIQASKKALAEAGIGPEEITGVLYVVPGLVAPHPIYTYAGEMGLNHDTEFMFYTAGGCVFGMTGFAKCHDHLRLHPTGACLLVAVELNSGMFIGGMQHQIAEAAKREFDGFHGHFKGQLITSALFGDLTTATVMLGSQHPKRQNFTELLPAVVSHKNTWVQNSTDHVGMVLYDEGYMGYLTTKLIKTGPDCLYQTCMRVLGDYNLQPSDIKHWVIHPGGPAIIKKLKGMLNLSDRDIEIAGEVYHEIGNVAACTAIEIMKRTILKRQKEAEEGDWVMGLAAGYGVCAQGVLFRWEKAGNSVVKSGLLTPPAENNGFRSISPE